IITPPHSYIYTLSLHDALPIFHPTNRIILSVLIRSLFSNLRRLELDNRRAISQWLLRKFWDWDYLSHSKELLLLILTVDISFDISYRSGNTLRFPRARDEPPHSHRTLAEGSHRLRFPAGVFVYFLC